MLSTASVCQLDRAEVTRSYSVSRLLLKPNRTLLICHESETGAETGQLFGDTIGKWSLLQGVILYLENQVLCEIAKSNFIVWCKHLISLSILGWFYQSCLPSVSPPFKLTIRLGKCLKAYVLL